MHKECKKHFKKVSQYLDGELDARTCEKIRLHLQECPECRHCVDSLRKTIDLCRKLPKEKVPPEMKRDLLETLRKAFTDRASQSS